MKDLLTDDVDDRQCKRIKKPARYDDSVKCKPSCMKKKAVVQMKDRSFGGRDLKSVIYLLKDFKAACIACSIHESAEL